ncbi:hypothetical protein FQN57_006989 [Myotisia sp. PD_48]|nr:hypothetical protein FQN57_006989 [Myotisia sp. PD_48]
MENSQRSILHQLPSEIIIRILDYLPGHDTVLFGYTSRTFYYDYPTPDRSQDHSLCRKIGLNMPWEESEPPEVYRNQSEGSVLQFCPCKPHTRSSIKRETRWIGLYSIHCKCDDINMKSWMIMGPRGFIVTSDYLIGFLENSAPLQKSEIRSIFEQMDIPLCPHLSIGDTSILDGYEPGSLPFLDKGELPPPPSRNQESRFPNIMCDYCDSYFRFYAVEAFRCNSIFFLRVKTCRNIGKLNRMDDPFFISQLTSSGEPQLSRYWYTRTRALWKSAYDDYRTINVIDSSDKIDFEIAIRGINNLIMRLPEVPLDVPKIIKELSAPVFTSDRWKNCKR